MVQDQKNTVEDLYYLLKNDTIFTPSPLRLLRLVNGRRCEACNKTKVKHANQCLGTFLCSPCLGQGDDRYNTRLTPRKARKARGYEQVIQDDRITGRWSGHWCGASYRESLFCTTLLRRPLMQSGELCGPRFTYSEKGAEPVQSMLDEMLPPQDNSEFIRTYESSVEEAKAAVEYRKEKKKEASERAAERRMASSLRILQKVQDLLEEPWKHYVLNYEETPGSNRKSPCLKFRSPLCNDLLGEYVTSPSKAKKATIIDIAKTINTHCQSISERLLGFEFLSEDDPFEKALKLLFLEKFPDTKSVLFHESADSHFASILSEDGPFKALEHLEGHFGLCCWE